MTTWLALVAILHAPPLSISHSGQLYQQYMINYYADRFLLTRWFATNLTNAESSFRIRLETKGWVGRGKHRRYVILSHGLMQTNPLYDAEFAASVGLSRFGWRNPGQSALVGLGRLAWLMKRYHGDMILSAAAYNAGMKRIESSKEIPAETMAYLTKIFGKS